MQFWLLSEWHHEFNELLNVEYIDIKAVFDSVDRCALWKALRRTEASPFLVNLIEDLPRGTTLLVRVADQLSQPFETTSEVRQGCTLASALCCIAINWILSSCVDSVGTFVGAYQLTDQDYGDDAAFFTDNTDK